MEPLIASVQDVLALAGGLLIRLLVGVAAIAALLLPVLAIVGLRLLWTRLRHGRVEHRQLADWFAVPDGYAFHRGHTWAKRDRPGVAVVGMDDFAQQLVGPIGSIELPRRGDALRAGRNAWQLCVESQAIGMLAPVSGTVVAVNELLETTPELANRDPYGRGWVCVVELSDAATGFAKLLTGASAHAWMSRVTRELEMTFTPELGHVLQDGGAPIHGFARAVDEAHWAAVVKKFLGS